MDLSFYLYKWICNIDNERVSNNYQLLQLKLELASLLDLIYTSENAHVMCVALESPVFSKDMIIFHSIGENKIYMDRWMLFELNMQLKITF